MGRPRQFAVLCIVALAIGCLLIGGSSCRILEVRSTSMEPTLHQGDWVIVRKELPIRRGQIVTFWSPDEPTSVYIKRVIGIGRDHLHVALGKVVLNGVELGEPYVLRGAGWSTFALSWPNDNQSSVSMRDISVPIGTYFVMGDNRTTSTDSRAFGSIPERNILGVVILTLHRATHGVP
jgi:signal peptidase I